MLVGKMSSAALLRYIELEVLKVVLCDPVVLYALMLPEKSTKTAAASEGELEYIKQPLLVSPICSLEVFRVFTGFKM